MFLNQPVPMSSTSNPVRLFNIRTPICWYQLLICNIHRINSHRYHGSHWTLQDPGMCTFILHVGCLFSFAWYYSSPRFRLRLCTICWVVLNSFFFLLRSKRSHSSFSSFLSSTTRANLDSSSAVRRYFSLNQSSGVLTVRQNTPAGSYWLRVGVSDGVWPDVISGIRVHVRDLEEKAILSSASLRLTGIFSGNRLSRWLWTSTSVSGCYDLNSK